MKTASLLNLQPLLEPAKGTPDFTVCTSPDHPEIIFVYYGLALIEKVCWSAESLEFKMLLARLYNARIKLNQLTQTFDAAHTTLRRWGRALKSGDIERIKRAFSGQGAEKKLTSDVVRYVRNRFNEIYVTNKYNYSQIIRGEIKKTFDKDISAECLRLIFKEEKEKFANSKSLVAKEGSTLLGASAAESKVSSSADSVKGDEQGVIPCDFSADSSLILPKNRNYSLFKEKMGGMVFSGQPLPDCPYICHHAGLVLFSVLIDRVLSSSYPDDSTSDENTVRPTVAAIDTPREDIVKLCIKNSEEEKLDSEGITFNPSEALMPVTRTNKVFPETLPKIQASEQSELLVSTGSNVGKLPIVRQWVASILLGAINHEQSKKLSFRDLQFLIGPQVKSLNHQRKLLGELATPTNTQALYRQNAMVLDDVEESDFYYDPQGEEYTGELKILKSWCGRRGRVTKVLYNDFIHCSNGWPAYTKCWDSYYDMRERFFPTITEFRQVWRIEKRRCTWVMDRGIYSLPVFQQIQDSSFDHFITWEKDFRGGEWHEEKKDGVYTMSRARNNSLDTHTYRYHYMDGIWPRDKSLRRLIVRVESSSNSLSKELSIITDDTTRPAGSIILLMFQRWLQENDFRYSIVHVGINELTSRSYVSYQELKEQLVDKDVESAHHKDLKKKKQKLNRDFAKLLVNSEHAAVAYQETCQEIDKGLLVLNKKMVSAKKTSDKSKTDDLETRKRTLINKRKRLQSNYKKKAEQRNETIEKFNKSFGELDQELRETKGKVSRLEILEKEGYKRLDTRRKAFYDAIRISSRNIFFTLLGDFRPRYNNYRDDHVVLRELTRSPGVIIKRKNYTEIALNPAMHYQPKVKKIVKEFLQKIADDINSHFGQRYSTIRITLFEPQNNWFIQNQ